MHSGPLSASRSLPAMLCALLVLLGILLIGQGSLPILLPHLPTGPFAGVFPHPQLVIYGTLLLLVGCLGCGAFLTGCLDQDVHDGSAPSAAPFTLAPSLLRCPFVAPLLGCGCLLYLVALGGALAHSTAYWVLVPSVLMSVLLLSFALRALTNSFGGARIDCWSLGEWAFLLGMVGAFVAFNVHDLREWMYSYWGDEWPFYALAQSIARGAGADPFSQHGVFGIHPIMDSLYQALLMRIVGVDVTGWRVSSVLAAALPIIPVYALGRQFGGPALAGAAAIFYAGCPLLWAFCHIGYNNNDPLLPMCVAAALCYRGIRTGAPVHFYAAGAFAGACWYSIFTGRLMIVVLLLLLLTEWQGGIRGVARRLVATLSGFALVVLPIFLDNGPRTLTAMSHNTPLSQGLIGGVLGGQIGRNILRACYAFLYSTAHDHYTAGAFFDPLAATALCIGVVLALRNWRHPASRLLLCWFLVTLFLTTPLNDTDAVSATRSMVIVPPAALLAAWGLCSLAGVVADSGRRWSEAASALALCAVLCASLGFSLHRFYVEAPAHRYTLYPTVVMLMEAVLASDDTTLILPVDIQEHNPNLDLCLVLDGFGVAPSRVLYPLRGTLVPYCARASTPTHTHILQVLQATLALAESCVAPSQVLVEKNGVLWIYAIRIPRTTGVPYLPLLYQLAGQLCRAPFY